MGLRAGFPDLMLLVPRKTKWSIINEKWSHGLFIELKTQKGKVSPVQKLYHDKLISQDYAVTVCRSFEETQNQIKSWLMRASGHELI